MKSVMAHDFSGVPTADIQRSRFDRSCGYKTTFDAGYLIPFFLDEALPGDTFNLRTAGFVRMATPIFPLMDNLYMDTHYFCVPMRLVWENWERMLGAQDNPSDSTDYIIPTITSPGGSGYSQGTVYDYMGLPTQVPGLEHSALFNRAINLIYNEWYRSEDLQDSVFFTKDDGPDDPQNYTLLRRGKRHDYYTSSLPFVQKGPSVEIPLGSTAPVVPVDPAGWFSTPGGAPLNLQTAPAAADAKAYYDQDFTGNFDTVVPLNAQVDLANATAATINQLRLAFQIQKMYERDARGGTRYAEILQAHYNVTDPMHAVIQRPVYLGGSSTPIQVNQVAQTSDLASVGGAGTVGKLGAYALGAFDGHGFTKSFTEFCIVVGFVSVRADLNYQQGLQRMFSRSDRFDFYWPALAHIGEQAVLNKEIYAQGSVDLVADDEPFGYQERYAEYRYKNSQITGLFRSNVTDSLDTWHLAQDFANLPVLNSEFIEENPPVDRVIAVQNENQFIGDFHHTLHCARPMPMYGVPGNIDRF